VAGHRDSATHDHVHALQNILAGEGGGVRTSGICLARGAPRFVFHEHLQIRFCLQNQVRPPVILGLDFPHPTGVNLTMSRNNRPSISPLLPGTRPPPPDRLRPDMREEWRKIIARMPAGWFGLETLPLLEELCRCICYGRQWGAYIDKVDPDDLETRETPRFKTIFSQYTRIMALSVSLAGKLRLTTASQRDVRNSRAMFGTDPLSADKPWAADDGDDAPVN